ncbi:MAG: hypothetical protein ACRENE_34865 [Polyangiaceae bacterium]
MKTLASDLADLARADARWLMLLPLCAALVFGVLLLPWAPTPEGVPVPSPDAAALRRVVDADRAAAARAVAEPLPGAVRSLGSALRAYHTLEASQASEGELAVARAAVDGQLPGAFGAGDDALVTLRAVQLEGFLAEVEQFESTGRPSSELDALAGSFVRSMTREGWAEGHSFMASVPVLRVMFKEMWDRFLGLENRPPFAPTLDEQRALYAFYLSHPHLGSTARERVEALRRGARDAKDCAAANSLERRGREKWRLERVARIAALDPGYPGDYARGIASYGAGAFEESAEAFRTWLRAHPSGPYTLRAQAFLRAAVLASRVD